MTAIEFEKGNTGYQTDKTKEARNFFPGKQGDKEYVSGSTEGVSSESASGCLKSVLSEISNGRKDRGIDRTTIYTNDCLRDYYFLKKEEVRFLSEPSYTTDGLVAEFVDHSGNTYVLVEKRNYLED